MVSFNLKVLAKFGLCSNCSQKLDGCSRARARKIFATACQMLVLSKLNTLLACMLADTCKDHSIPLNVWLRGNVKIFHSPSLNLTFFSRGLGI